MRFNYSKWKLLYDLFTLLKYNFVLLLISVCVYLLFDTTWVKIAFFSYLFILIYYYAHKCVETYCTSYTFSTNGITEATGLFSKVTRYIPTEKIQNIQSDAPFLMRLFWAQKVMLETGELTSDIHLQFIHRKKLEVLLAFTPEEVQQQFYGYHQRETLFTTSMRDLLKASIGTCLFILLLPIALAVLKNEVGAFFFDATVPLIIKILVPIGVFIVAAIVSLIKVLLSYYQYEVTMDAQRVFIKKGVFSKKSFSIRKENIQTVIYKQQWYQKLLNVTTVKLNSTGEINSADSEEINELFPYISVPHAQRIVEKIVPAYQLKEYTHAASPKAMRTIFYQPPLYALFIAAASFFFHQPYFYILAGLLTVLHYVHLYLRIKHQQFRFDDTFYQIKIGGISNEIVIGTRAKVVAIQFKETFVDRKCDVLRSTITARSTPITKTEIIGIGKEEKVWITNWFAGRKEDVSFEE